MKDKYEGLDLTDEEKAVIQRYMQYVQDKRWQSTLAPFYAQVDQQFPGLDQAERQKLAEKLLSEKRRRDGLARYGKAIG